MKIKLFFAAVSMIFVLSVIHAQTNVSGSSGNVAVQAQQNFPGTLGDQSMEKIPVARQDIQYRFVGEAQKFLQYGQITNRRNPWNKTYQAQPVQVLPAQAINRQNPWQIGTGSQHQPLSQNGGSFPFTPGLHQSTQGYADPFRNSNQYGQGNYGNSNYGYGQPYADGFWPNMNSFGGNGFGFPSFPMGMF